MTVFINSLKPESQKGKLDFRSRIGMAESPKGKISRASMRETLKSRPDFQENRRDQEAG